MILSSNKLEQIQNKVPTIKRFDTSLDEHLPVSLPKEHFDGKKICEIIKIVYDKFYKHDQDFVEDYTNSKIYFKVDRMSLILKVKEGINMEWHTKMGPKEKRIRKVDSKAREERRCIK